VSLQTELDDLAKNIASFSKPSPVNSKTWNEFAKNSVVALMAGGESSRYAAVVGGKKIQKNAHELPNGDTMIEMAIRTYRDAGIKKFVALVFHNAHTVEDRLGDGSKLGVEIVYSHDPEKPVGKGGAVRNAIENGSIPLDHNLIVVNPDDVVLNSILLPRFLQLFSLKEKNDFEQILFPILAKESKLWSVGLTEGTWIAVNDLKSYNSLTKMLEQIKGLIS
jgi:NDP-sugar pyrophosphorylase family protein